MTDKNRAINLNKLSVNDILVSPIRGGNDRVYENLAMHLHVGQLVFSS